MLLLLHHNIQHLHLNNRLHHQLSIYLPHTSLDMNLMHLSHSILHLCLNMMSHQQTSIYHHHTLSLHHQSSNYLPHTASDLCGSLNLHQLCNNHCLHLNMLPHQMTSILHCYHMLSVKQLLVDSNIQHYMSNNLM